MRNYKNENFAATLCRSGERGGRACTALALTKIVLYSTSVYTVFHSVIYNSVAHYCRVHNEHVLHHCAIKNLNFYIKTKPGTKSMNTIQFYIPYYKNCMLTANKKGCADDLKHLVFSETMQNKSYDMPSDINPLWPRATFLVRFW